MKIIGLMSGTSLDGVDAALCEISGAPPSLNASILKSVTLPYDADFREQIIAACAPGRNDELGRLHMALGERFAEAILALVEDPAQVDLVASHGQTVWHDVDASGTVLSTLQLGSAAVIVEITGITTINNFRERDVAAGGQGAPLTAYVDWLLLRHPQQWRAVQNIGGMGNVSFLPPLSDQHSDLLAFDTGPGNALMDAAMFLITEGDQSYDQDGAFAGSGTVDKAWLEELLAHPYFQQAPPRTTGRELFGSAMAEMLVAQGHSRQRSNADILATLNALTAHSIAAAYRDFAPRAVQQVIVGGGGAHNKTLLRNLQNLLRPAQVLTHADIGLSSDFKEALVFAVLAYESWHHRVGCLPSQTGARRGTVLGQITPGDNYARLIQETWG